MPPTLPIELTTHTTLILVIQSRADVHEVNAADFDAVRQLELFQDLVEPRDDLCVLLLNFGEDCSLSLRQGRPRSLFLLAVTLPSFKCAYSSREIADLLADLVYGFHFYVSLGIWMRRQDIPICRNAKRESSQSRSL